MVILPRSPTKRKLLGNGLLGQEEDGWHRVSFFSSFFGLCRPLLVACSVGERGMQPLFSWKQQPIRSYTQGSENHMENWAAVSTAEFPGSLAYS